ncbi:MAG: ATP-binding protein [bacterium]
MKYWLRKLFIEQSLSLKIIFYIGTVLIAGILISFYLNRKTHEKGMMDLMRFQYYETSNFIKSYIRYTMLAHGSREEVQTMIEAFGYREDFTKITVLCGGRISISSWREEIGMKKNTEEKECTACHLKRMSTPLNISIHRSFKDTTGNSIIEVFNPIENEHLCHRCHDPEKKIVGVLYIKAYNRRLDHLLASGKKELVLATMIIFLLVSLEIGYFIYRFVHIPIQKLNVGTKKIAEGDLDYHIDIKSFDEIGQLAGSFNIMTDHIKQSRDEIERWNRELEMRVADATSQLVEVNRKLVETNKHLELTDKNKTEILITVAENLKGPISAITNCIDVVLDGYVEKNVEKRNEMLQRARRRLAELLRFISDMMDISMLHSSELLFTPIDPGKVYDGVVKEIEKRAKQQDITLIAHKLVEPQKEKVLAHQDLLYKVLLYIADNALKYSHRGSQVTVEMGLHNGNLEWKVMDKGIGIPHDELSCIFDLSFRGILAKDHSKGGSGVSLSLVKNFVSAFKGEISVASTQDHGTTVIIQLPLMKDYS